LPEGDLARETMPQILFKREFFDAIRSGRKTTTLRRWKRCTLSAGVRATSPGLGTLRIIACDRVELETLREADARADGFATLEEMRRVIKRIYPKLNGDGRTWYRIEFKLAASPGKQTSNAKKPKKQAKNGNNGALGRANRHSLAKRIRAELDKAVRQHGLLSAI
jgi:hypothetical protein